MTNCISQVHSLAIFRHATCNPQIWEGARTLSLRAASLSNRNYLIICGEIKNLQLQKKPTILFIIQSMAGEFCFELILLFAGLRN